MRTLTYAAVAGVLVVAALMAAVSLNHGVSSRLIVGDGCYYYAWARSALLDGDADFRNDLSLICVPARSQSDEPPLTPDGKVINKTPVGLAILEVPGLLLGGLVAWLFSFPADGVSAPYQLAVFGTLVALYAFSWFLLFRAMVRWGIHPACAFLFWIGMVGATNFAHYFVKEPAMAHAAGVSLASLIVFLISGWPADTPRVPIGRAVGIGLLFGLLVLVRNSNITLVPFFLAALAARRGATWRGLLTILLSSLCVVTVQLGASYALWGRIGYYLYPGESFTSNWHGIFGTLFSHQNGLFVYHPWYAVLLAANVAALFLPSKHRWMIAGALAGWLVLAICNGLWWCWHFGASYGNRAFIESLVPLTFGAALGCSAWYSSRRFRLALWAVLVLCCMANAYLWAGYLLNGYSSAPESSLREVYGWGSAHQW